MKEIVFYIVAYIIYSVVAKFVKQVSGDDENDNEVGMAEALGRLQVLRGRVDRAIEDIAAVPQEARLPLQLIQAVYKRELDFLYVAASDPEGTELSSWIVDAWSGRLQSGINALVSHSRRLSEREPSFLWVGSVLNQSLDDFIDETEEVIGAKPHLDILQAQNLARSDLRHLYSAWSDRLFADATTAVLDPKTATMVLEKLKHKERALWGEGEEPPPIVRAHVMALATKSAFNVQSHSDWGSEQELFVTDSNGSPYALPIDAVLQDIESIVNDLLLHPFVAFDSQTLQQVKDGFDALEYVTPYAFPEPQYTEPEEVAPVSKMALLQEQLKEQMDKLEQLNDQSASTTADYWQIKTAKFALNRPIQRDIVGAVVLGEVLDIR